MTVTISEFRKSPFQLVEKARNGESVEFTHQGEVFSVVPQKRPSRLALVPSNPNFPGMSEEDFEEFQRERRKAYEKKLEEEWP